jgi:hypothetical protein
MSPNSALSKRRDLDIGSRLLGKIPKSRSKTLILVILILPSLLGIQGGPRKMYATF